MKYFCTEVELLVDILYLRLFPFCIYLQRDNWHIAKDIIMELVTFPITGYLLHRYRDNPPHTFFNRSVAVHTLVLYVISHEACFEIENGPFS